MSEDVLKRIAGLPEAIQQKVITTITNVKEIESNKVAYLCRNSGIPGEAALNIAINTNEETLQSALNLTKVD